MVGACLWLVVLQEVEAVHRCLAKGLRETPQHTRADSLQLIYIIDQFQAQAGGNAHG